MLWDLNYIHHEYMNVRGVQKTIGFLYISIAKNNLKWPDKVKNSINRYLSMTIKPTDRRTENAINTNSCGLLKNELNSYRKVRVDIYINPEKNAD